MAGVNAALLAAALLRVARGMGHLPFLSAATAAAVTT